MEFSSRTKNGKTTAYLLRSQDMGQIGCDTNNHVEIRSIANVQLLTRSTP